MKIILLTPLILLLGILSSIGQVPADSNIAVYYKTDYFEAAIFPASYSGIFVKGKKKFTPTKVEVDSAELALRTQLKALNTNASSDNQSAGDPIVHENLDNYRRQYEGRIDANGHRILYINSFWKKERDFDFNKVWLKRIIDISDGGSYFWEVKFDLNTGKLFGLFVHGTG